MMSIFKKLLRDNRGTSAVEYGLICSLIILAMLAALQNFASESTRTWNTVASTTHAAVAGATAS